MLRYREFNIGDFNILFLFIMVIQNGVKCYIYAIFLALLMFKNMCSTPVW